jgi:FO synthase
MVTNPASMRRVLRRASRGDTLNPAEAAVLLEARDDDLVQLMRYAARVRDAGLADAGRPATITFSPKVFVPLTRLCRNRCHYCAFVTVPHRLTLAGEAPYLSADEVLGVARQGRAAGCLEALFTLGERPEDRWPAAREWLDEHGYDSTLSYLRAMAILVLEETGLLPHLNPGVLSWEELNRLKPVAPSMGMMLETTAKRLHEHPGACHYGSPDKDPVIRLRTLEDAGRLAVPFTTGILVGIGETLEERAESIFAIRQAARRYGHVQEVIVQAFRAKSNTAMSSVPDAGVAEHLAAIAVTRLLLGPRARIQAPPNLSAPDELPLLLEAGIDDWGGVSPVTPDHVNPERPWPHLDALEEATARAGLHLRRRLAVHPEYLRRGEPWIDPRVMPHVLALADTDTGLASTTAAPVGMPWQEPDPAWADRGRTDLHASIDVAGRSRDRRGDFDEIYGDWSLVRDSATRLTSTREPQRLPGEVTSALHAAERDPAGLSDSHAYALAGCDGPALAALTSLADAVRQDTVGDVVTYVVNRNINFTNVCYTGCRFCAFAQRRTDPDAYTLSIEEVGRRAAQAWAVGATEVCLQGGIDPDLPATAYIDLIHEIKQRVPEMHVHAFSPMEIVNAAARSALSIRDFLLQAKDAGLGSIPGTAAEILDDEVRWVLTKGKLPTATWIDVVTTAHEVGLRSSSTMMFGHVDTPRHWVDHLRLLARIQDETGGFTEFVPLPFVHHNAPLYLAGAARPGPTRRDNLSVHALARLLLHGRIPNIQTSWVKLGVAGTQAMLRAGANDLGGTLMEETISRMAGSEHGSAKSADELERIAVGIERPARPRTTTYELPPSERPADTSAGELGRLLVASSSQLRGRAHTPLP